MRWDMIIQCLWDQQADAIINIKLGDANADSYKYEPMVVILAWWEIINKDKHGKHCHDQRKNFPYSLLIQLMD